MFEFELTEEQRILRKNLERFGSEVIAPSIREIDDKERIPQRIIEAMAELGLLGMNYPSKFGGSDADPVTVGVVVEQLARSDITCAIPTFFLVQCAWGHILKKYGKESVKSEILPKVTKGKAFLGIAATEPGAGSDLANITTVAKRKGNRYVISGEKMFISGIREITEFLPDAGGYITIVKTDPALGARGLSLIYVPIEKSKTGITVLKDWGRRGISTGGFALDQAEVPVENLIGEENKGFKIAMEGFDYARGLISIVCSGVAMSALEYAMQHLKQRKAFGQPIGKFEGVQFKLAEHWSKIEAVRLLGYKALNAFSIEQSSKGLSRLQVTRLCAEAKMLAPVFAFEAINDAIQWFGAYGYTTDCPLELALKGVRSYFWAEGTLEIMKIIVARELLGKEYTAYR
ncbi:MAG: acyl-CoA dehydrogenase family protein [bacterium]